MVEIRCGGCRQVVRLCVPKLLGRLGPRRQVLHVQRAMS